MLAPSVAPKPRLSELLESFTLALRAGNRSEGTLDWYGKKLSGLLRYLGDVEASDISTVSLRRWLLMVKQGRRGVVSDQTVEHHRKAVRRLFTWARTESPPLVLHDPSAGLAPWIVEKRELPAPTTRNVEALRAGVGSPEPFIRERDECILAVFIGGGVRVGELVRIRLGDVDMERGIKIRGKGRRERRIPLTPRLRSIVVVYMALHRDRLTAAQLLFPHRRGGPLSTNGVRKRLRLAASRGGADGPSYPHALRHYFATEFLRDGGDRKAAKIVLGHSSDAMLDRYTNFLDADVAVQVALHSPLERRE